MVGRWGMSERIGPVSVLPQETRRISDDCYAEARRLIEENRDRLDGIVIQLLEHETLDEAEIYTAACMPMPVDRPRPATSRA